MNFEVIGDIMDVDTMPQSKPSGRSTSTGLHPRADGGGEVPGEVTAAFDDDTFEAQPTGHRPELGREG